MTDDSTQERDSTGLSTTRRALLAAAGAGSVAAGLASAQDAPSLLGGSMVSDPHNVAGDLYIGPESDLSQVSPDEGRVYIGADTDREFYGDGSSWQPTGKFEKQPSGDLTPRETGVAFEAESVNTESADIGERLDAANYDGSSGGDQIQNALDALPSEGGVVVVGPNGPDDVTSSSGGDASRGVAAWEITSPIEMPDYATLFINGAYLFATDNLDDNLIRNKTAGDGTSDRNTDISVMGTGPTAWIDGNDGNQDTEISDAYRSGLHFHKVDGLTISNLKVGPIQAFAIVPEDCPNFSIKNIELNQNNDTFNEDGIHVVGPQKFGTIDTVWGEVGDDALAMNATYEGGAGPTQGYGSGGNVEFISASNINTNQLEGGTSTLRIAGSDQYAVRNISLDGGSVTNGHIINMGGGDDVTKFNNQRNISVSDFTIHGMGAAVKFRAPSETRCQQLSLNNINNEDSTLKTLIDLNGYRVRGLSVSDCNLLVDGSDTDAIVRLAGGSIENSDISVTVEGDDSSNLIDITSGSTVKGLNCRATLVNLGFPIVESGATVEKVFFDIVSRSAPSDYDINEPDVYADGREFHTLSDTGKQALAGGRTVQTTITVINTSDNTVETFTLHGSGNSVTQHGGDTTNFGTTEGNDGTVNVYWDSTNSQYEINNEEGGTRYLEVLYEPLPKS